MEAIRYENSEIDERIIRAVTEIGYEEMTPIQQSAIPALLEGSKAGLKFPLRSLGMLN